MSSHYPAVCPQYFRNFDFAKKNLNNNIFFRENLYRLTYLNRKSDTHKSIDNSFIV